MPTIVRQTATTPREQIQGQARIAAEKVRQAMSEFSAATGMCASVDVFWVQAYFIESDRPVNVVQDVAIRFSDEARA